MNHSIGAPDAMARTMAILSVLQESKQTGRIPLLELPPAANQRIAKVLQAAGFSEDSITVREALEQDSSLRIYAPGSPETGFDIPVIGLRPTWLSLWGADPDSPRILLSFAHEIGHFAKGHFEEDPQDLSRRHEREFEADEFAGGVAARLGLNRSDIEDWIASLNDPDAPNAPAGADSHPPLALRVQRALLGFDQAQGHSSGDSTKSFYQSPLQTGLPAIGRPPRTQHTD